MERRIRSPKNHSHNEHKHEENDTANHFISKGDRTLLRCIHISLFPKEFLNEELQLIVQGQRIIEIELFGIRFKDMVVLDGW
ncbi:hypothetical protein D3C80_1794920 [compost metagenome]